MTAPRGRALLSWYDRHRRTMPWRAQPGERADPYRVWLSEIMLQQTTVATVTGYFERFLARFPTLEALAAAEEESVLRVWAGLGYYARARNLHRCARALQASGDFPRDVAGLRALPGVGEYTAAAIASIAFGIPVVPVDGNVQRVVARLFAIETPLPTARREIATTAARWTDDPVARARPGDFTQALFDLGATVCTPRTPECRVCPWQDACQARLRGLATALPRKAPRPDRPQRHGVHFWLEDAEGAVLLRRRPRTGLLGGMLELPGTVWRAAPWSEAEAMASVPQPARWERAGSASHGFTHFTLALEIYRARVERIEVEGLIRAGEALDAEALPTVMRRCIEVVQKSRMPFSNF